MEVLSTTTNIGNSNVHLLTAGPEDGHPVFLFHGASFTSKTWQDIGTIAT